MSTNVGGDFGGGGEAGVGGGYVNPTFPRRPTGTAAVRRSRSYGRPYPIVYGTAAVLGVPLWVYDKGDASVALDGANAGDMRVAEVQYAFGFGPVTSIDGIIYEKRSYRTGGLDPKHLSGRDGATWPYPPEFYVGDGTTTAWAHYSASDASTRIPWRKLALMRCQRFGVPGGAGTTPEIRALVRGKYATHSNAKRNEEGGWTRYDAAPGDVIRDLLEDATYGMGLPSGTVVTAVGADGLAASSYDRYCEQSGWWVALAIDGAASIADIVEQVLTATNSVGMWSGGKFKIIPLGDVAVGTYSPVLTALAITNDDFVCERDEDAITTTRQAWADTWNVVEVEYSADTVLRDAELVTTESPDVANVSVWGMRRAPEVVSLPCIRSKKHAQEISGILARRSCYHRSRFEFRVTIRHGAALEVGDLVALTHDVMGFSNRLARVEMIEARPNGTYRVEAREWVTGASVTVLTTPEGALGLGNNPVPDWDPFASVGSLADDGLLSPVEKPAFVQAVTNIWHAVREGEDSGSADLAIHGTTLTAASLAFYNYLQTIDFEYAWVDIDRVWTDPGDRAAQRALLAAWMVETTPVVADDYRAAFGAVETAIADARSTLVTVATGTTTSRSLPVRFTDVTNVLDFQDDGVDPEGATDSTAGFAAAAAACAANGGGDLIIPAGEFLLADLPAVSGVRWIGQGAGRTKLTRLNAGGSEAYLLKFNGTVGSASNLTANVDAGAYSVAVGNGALWAAGDWALIRESTYVATTVGRKQQIVRVLSVSSNTVYFDRPLFEGYFTSATAQLCQLSPVVNAGLYDLALEGVNASSKGGIIRAQYAIGLNVDGVVAQWFSSGAGFSLSTCLDSHLHGVTVRDGVDMSTAGQGYGAEFDEACALCSITDSTFENVREVTFTNRTAWSRFARNRCVGNYDSGFNTHGSFNTHIDVDDNEIVGVRVGCGIAVGYGTHSAGDQFIAVRRNVVKHAASYGILSNAPSTKENERITFEGNRVYPKGSNYGMAVTRTKKLRSSDNLVDFQGAAGNTGYYLVEVNRGRMRGDWVRDATGTYGFRVDTCTDLDLDACETDGLDTGYEVLREGTNTRVTFRRGTTYTP